MNKEKALNILLITFAIITIIIGWILLDTVIVNIRLVIEAVN